VDIDQVGTGGVGVVDEQVASATERGIVLGKDRSAVGGSKCLDRGIRAAAESGGSRDVDRLPGRPSGVMCVSWCVGFV
jgi:hypothetical protein